MIIRIDEPVIEIDKWVPDEDSYPKNWMVCTAEDCDGLILPMRLDKPPHTVSNDQYCVLCGQRYHFNNLGEEIEDQNEAFVRYFENED
jgi:hypothetical protein